MELKQQAINNNFLFPSDSNTDDRPLQSQISSQHYLPVEDNVRATLVRPVLWASFRRADENVPPAFNYR